MQDAAGIRVSVIVPVYNAEKTIGDCLDCILGQTLKELEVICVDDGSPDGSLAVLETYRKKDSRVRILRQENQGAGCARNHGMKEATGEFLAFFDADDLFEPDLLESAWKLCQKTGADICAWGADSFDAQTGEKDVYRAAFDKRYILKTNPFDPASDEARGTLLQMFNGVPWSKLFRTSFIRETGLQFQALRTTNDAFFVYSALCKARSIVTLDRVLVHRRKNGASSLTQTRERSWQCFYEALKAILDELERSGLLEKFERTFVNRALKNIFWNMDTVSPACEEQIAALMKQEGFHRLRVDLHGADAYEDPRLYERYTWLRDLDFPAYRLLCAAGRERDALREENRRLKEENKQLKKELQDRTESQNHRFGSKLSAFPKKIGKLVGK